MLFQNDSCSHVLLCKYDFLIIIAKITLLGYKYYLILNIASLPLTY